MQRGAAGLLLWAALCGVRGWPAPPPDLMPSAGRAMPFGRTATLALQEADHGVNVPFASRPPLAQSDQDWRLKLRWTGRAYQLIDPDPRAEMPEVGHLAVRALPGSATLFVAQTLWNGEAAYSYRLVARQTDGSFVYYHDNEECDAVPAATLARILPDANDRKACHVRNWRQVEALLTAFAATGPQPFGVAIPLP